MKHSESHTTEERAERESAADKILIKEVSINQPQTVMDLDTGSEDAKITLAMKRYSAPEYDAKKYAPLTEDEFNEILLEKAMTLVSPISEQIKAFTNKATSDSYQTAKREALAGGNYLSSDLRAMIVKVMKGNASYADVPAKDCFERWKAGYLVKKPGAIKLLDTAKSLLDTDDYDL